MKKNNKGFTLVELIIVIAIIAILTVTVAPQYLKYVEKARVSKDMDAAAAIEMCINIIFADEQFEGPGNIYWDVEGTAFRADASIPNGDRILNQLNEFLGGQYPVALSKTAKNVGTVTFTVATDTGAIKVTASPDYEEWDN